MMGSVCRVVMDSWLRNFKNKAIENEIEIKLATKYVDDINLFVRAMERGTHWSGGKKGSIKHTDEKESLDIENEMSRSAVTMRNIKDMANSICNELKVTTDDEDSHDDKTIPMLDVQAWRSSDGMRVRHKFYEKAVASQQVMGEKTAIPIKSKITILSQEVFRRLRNTGRNVENDERVRILDKFTEKLRRSGYRERERGEIIRAGIRCYYKRLRIEKEGGKKVNGNKGKRSVRKVRKIMNKNR